jgi:hypothetical protein
VNVVVIAKGTAIDAEDAELFAVMVLVVVITTIAGADLKFEESATEPRRPQSYFTDFLPFGIQEHFSPRRATSSYYVSLTYRAWA